MGTAPQLATLCYCAILYHRKCGAGGHKLRELRLLTLHT